MGKWLRAIIGHVAPSELFLEGVIGVGQDKDMGDVAKRFQAHKVAL